MDDRNPGINIPAIPDDLSPQGIEQRDATIVQIYQETGSYAATATRLGIHPRIVAAVAYAATRLDITLPLPTLQDVVADSLLIRERAEVVEATTDDERIALAAMTVQDRITRRLQQIATLGYEKTDTEDTWIIDGDLEAL